MTVKCGGAVDVGSFAEARQSAGLLAGGREAVEAPDTGLALFQKISRAEGAGREERDPEGPDGAGVLGLDYEAVGNPFEDAHPVDHRPGGAVVLLGDKEIHTLFHLARAEIRPGLVEGRPVFLFLVSEFGG